MNTRPLNPHSLTILSLALAVFALLLAACQPANASTSVPPVPPTVTQLPAQPPTDQPVALPTQIPATPPAAGVSGEITLDLSGLAQEQTVEAVPAVPASAERPYWEAAPAYRRVTLQGYTVTSHLMKPQIFVYPVSDLAAANEGMGKMAGDLQTLLGSQKAGEYLPFLPLFNAQQVFHAQVQYLDFKNGKGVRYLTQFDQAPLPINNFELIYTFQGLSSDGQFYIAAVLPVTHPELPPTQQVSPELEADFKDFPAYLAQTATWLDQQPAGSFTPDLAKLDALIQSIEVQ